MFRNFKNISTIEDEPPIVDEVMRFLRQEPHWAMYILLDLFEKFAQEERNQNLVLLAKKDLLGYEVITYLPVLPQWKEELWNESILKKYDSPFSKYFWLLNEIIWFSVNFFKYMDRYPFEESMSIFNLEKGELSPFKLPVDNFQVILKDSKLILKSKGVIQREDVTDAFLELENWSYQYLNLWVIMEKNFRFLRDEIQNTLSEETQEIENDFFQEKKIENVSKNKFLFREDSRVLDRIKEFKNPYRAE